MGLVEILSEREKRVQNVSTLYFCTFSTVSSLVFLATSQICPIVNSTVSWWEITSLSKFVTCCPLFSRFSFKKCSLSRSPYEAFPSFLYNLFYTHHFLSISPRTPLVCVLIPHTLQLLYWRILGKWQVSGVRPHQWPWACKGVQAFEETSGRSWQAMGKDNKARIMFSQSILDSKDEWVRLVE